MEARVCGLTLFSQLEIEQNQKLLGKKYYGTSNNYFGNIGLKFYEGKMKGDILNIYSKIHSFAYDYLNSFELTQNIEELSALYSYMSDDDNPIIIAIYSKISEKIFGSFLLNQDSKIKNVKLLGYDLGVYAGHSYIKEGFIDHNEFFKDVELFFNEYGLLKNEEVALEYLEIYKNKCKSYSIEPYYDDDVIDITTIYHISI